MRAFLKKYGVFAAAAVIFVVAAAVYCWPSLKGMYVRADDRNSFMSAAHENLSHQWRTGETSWWTGSMFCGMPFYCIGGASDYESLKFLKPVIVLRQYPMHNPIWAIALYFVCFFVLLLSFGISPWVSMFGALSIGLSSYFMVLFPAGHNTKIIAIAFSALLLAGYKFIMGRKRVLGTVLVMLSVASGCFLHPQAFYYFCMMAGLLWIADAWNFIKEKRARELCVSTAIFIAAIFIGMGTGSANIFSSREYIKESVRGGSVLAAYPLGADSLSTASSSGLSLDYMIRYSYGIDESMSLLVPGFKGGASFVSMPENSHVWKTLKERGYSRREIKDTCKNTPMYWGPQPYTAGNVYVGAIVFFLFILGILVVAGPVKWALLACTIFSLLLAWGSHFMWLTSLFAKYFPFYSKFRTVSSILVVAEVAMPLLGLLAIKSILEGKVETKRLVRSIAIAAGIPMAVCLFFAAAGPSYFDFHGVSEMPMYLTSPEWFQNAVIEQRRILLVGDCLRSAALVAAAAGLFLLAVRGKMAWTLSLVIVGCLSVADLWSIDQRYFNEDSYTSGKSESSTRPVDPDFKKYLVSDRSPSFRVYNTTKPLSADSETPYHFKSVGGYSAAKLSRYQDLIDVHLSKNHRPVFDMLNAKYFIVYDEDAKHRHPELNPGALGNAWWVRNVRLVDNPREEIDALMEEDLANTVIVDREFADELPVTCYEGPEEAMATMLEYHPDKLSYWVSSDKGGILVFSEIYYPHGWQAYVDGVPAPHYRVNYLLRGMSVPAGSHKITFDFDPDCVRKGDRVATVFIFIMYALFAAALCYGFLSLFRKKKNEKVIR